jgi:hemoglobin
MKMQSAWVNFWAVLIGLFAAAAASAIQAADNEPSLYDRIGGEPVARAICEDIWTNHTLNPIVSNRFTNSDPEYVKQKVFEIFAASTGGPVKYTGKDMLTTHATMNINDMEFNAVVDDVLKALDMNNVGARERGEVLAILWSVKDQVVNGKLTTRALAPATSAGVQAP